MISNNFGSGFNSGLSTVSRFMNSENSMKNRDIMTKARAALMEDQGAHLNEVTNEMPARLGLQGQSLQLKQQMMGLQAQLIAAKIKAMQSGAGMFNSHAPPALRMQQYMTNFLQTRGALDPTTGKVDLSKLNPYDLDQYKKMQGAYTKMTTDAATRTRLQRGANLLTTLNSVDMTPFEYYSGAKGKTQFLKDRAQASLGNPSEMYQKYIKNHGLLDTAGEQLGQYFGSSISQEAVDARSKVLNPSAWDVDPTDVKKAFERFRDLAKAEVSSTQQAILNSQDFYSTGVTNLLNGAESTGLPSPTGSSDTSAPSSSPTIKPVASASKIKAAMKQYGITEQQAIAALGGSNG